MIEDEALEELWWIKETISRRHDSIHEIAVEARRIARAEPLPVPGKQRKMIEGFPRGQSVGDTDPIMEELYKAKEALAKRFDYDIHRLAEYLRREGSKSNRTPVRKPVKKRPQASSFRSTKRKTANARRENEKN